MRVLGAPVAIRSDHASVWRARLVAGRWFDGLLVVKRMGGGAGCWVLGVR